MAAPGGGGMNQYGLGLIFQARDMASGVIGTLGANFGGLRDRITRGGPMIVGSLAAIGVGITALVVSLGTLSTAFDFSRIAGRFEQNMAAIGAVTRATSQEMRNLEASAVNAGIATQFSPREAAEGLQSLATAGQNAQQAITTLNPVLDLAAGSLGQLGVGEAAMAVVGTLNAYGLAAGDAVSVTDRLLRATQISNFQARDFEVGLSRAAAAGSQFGTSLNDVLITLGLLRNANIEASVASTAFRESVRRVYTDERALQALQRLGVESYDRETRAARSALDIMQDAADAMRNMTDEERNANAQRIFGTRGINAFNSVMRAQVQVVQDGERVTLRGADAIRHLRGEMAAASGTAATFREQVLSTFQGQMVLLQGTVETLKTVIGLTFSKLFRPVVLLVTETLNMFIRVWMSIPESGRLLIGTLTIISAIFLGIAGIILTVVGAFALFLVFAAEVLIIVGLMGAAIFAAGALFAAWGASIAAIAYIVYRAWQQNLGGLSDWINGWVKRISLTWRALTELFTEGGFSEAVMRELNQASNKGIRDFVLEIYAFGQRLREFWRGFTEAIGNAWKRSAPYWDELRKALNQLGAAFAQLFGPGGDMIVGANTLPGEKFAEFGNTVGTGVGGGISAVAQGLTKFVQLMTIIIDAIGRAMPYIIAISEAWWGVHDALAGVRDIIAEVSRAIVRAPELLFHGARWLLGSAGGRETVGQSVAELQQFVSGPGAAGGADRSVQLQANRLTVDQLRRAQAAKSEEVVATPSVGVGASGSQGQSRVVDAVNALANRDRGTIETELTVNDEVLARTVTAVQERNGTLEGRLVGAGGGGGGA